jgi:MoaA/NifB/PqqE/SkfB family radical SAM enzyme
VSDLREVPVIPGRPKRENYVYRAGTETVKILSDVSLALQGLHHKISDTFQARTPLPFSLALSVIGVCNSKCATCNIWTIKTRESELEAWEWERVMAQLGPHIKFYTYSGGEPFMRDDFDELLFLPFKYGNPRYVTVPTNCLLPDRIHYCLQSLFEKLKPRGTDATLYCNLSVDGIGDRHDELRGVKGNFAKVLKTIDALREIRAKHSELKIGIHAVVSRFNINDIAAIYEYFLPLPYIDSITCELAQRRHELLNTVEAIAPSREEFGSVVAGIVAKLANDKRLDPTTKALRFGYYDFAAQWLATNRQPIPCYAGRASCQITPDGKVVACGVRWVEEGFMGDLRDVDYDFKKVWYSEKAESVRRSIRNYECACPLSNGYYASIPCNPGQAASTFLRKLRLAA